MKGDNKKSRAKSRRAASPVAQVRQLEFDLAGVDRLIDIGIRHSLNGDSARWWVYWRMGRPLLVEEAKKLSGVV